MAHPYFKKLGFTELLHQCQKPGFWLGLCIKTNIFRQKPGFLLGLLSGVQDLRFTGIEFWDAVFS
jgi:hypothetical protein